MIKEVINRLFRWQGYEVNSLAHKAMYQDGFEQFTFVNPDGSFNYEHYRDLQKQKSSKHRRDNLHEFSFALCDVCDDFPMQANRVVSQQEFETEVH